MLYIVSICIIWKIGRQKQSGRSQNRFIYTNTHFCLARSRSIASKNVAITPTCYLSAARISKRGIRGACAIPRARSTLRLPFARMHVLFLRVLSLQRAHFFSSIRMPEPLDIRARYSVREERPMSWTSDIARVWREKEPDVVSPRHPNEATVSSGRQPGLHCPGLPFLPPKDRHRYLVPHPRPLSVCRDNLPFTSHPLTYRISRVLQRTNERVLFRKSSPLATPPDTAPFALSLPPFLPSSPLPSESARRTAQSASSHPLLSRVSGKKPSSHGRPMQDEGRDQDIASGASVRRVGACVDFDYCVLVARVWREIRNIMLRFETR